MTKIPATLEQSLGKSIGQLCPFSLGKLNNQNHCAHYVSHMMGYEFSGPTCKNFTWSDKQKSENGATIRVDDIFKRCTTTGLLSAKPAGMTQCLIFVTLASNVKKMGAKMVMGNNPKKHIGILNEAQVWNYSNSGDKVVADTKSSFRRKFTHAYQTAGTTVEFYYGNLI